MPIKKSGTTKVEVNGTTLDVPNSYVCPISLQVMVSPVLTPSGLHFERSAILSWLENGTGCCPLTSRPMDLAEIVPNNDLKSQIHAWRIINGVGIAIDEAQCKEETTFFDDKGRKEKRGRAPQLGGASDGMARDGGKSQNHRKRRIVTAPLA
jgi:hypothetical protein